MMHAVCQARFSSSRGPDSERWEKETQGFCFREVKERESPVQWSQQVLCLSGLNTFSVLGVIMPFEN